MGGGGFGHWSFEVRISLPFYSMSEGKQENGFFGLDFFMGPI